MALTKHDGLIIAGGGLAGSLLALAMAGIARATLPQTVQMHPLRYRALMLSILHLARSQPVLRTASLSQALLFAAFNAFWLMALKDRPGGSISPFWLPAMVTSTPHSSCR